MSTLEPIFIGGMFKSGTSLLRAMIGRHSQVASGLETYWFDLDWGNLHGPATVERLRVMRSLFDFTPEEFAAMVNASSCAEELLDRTMNAWAARHGKPRWAEKTPGNVARVARIRAYWPGARVVHIMRDPRDVFASLRQARKWDTLPEFMERWGAIFGAVERFRTDPNFDHERYLEVRYCDLVSDPDACMRSVWAFVGLEHEEATAAFDGVAGDFDKVREVTGKESTTLARLAKPMTQERQGIWRSVLTDAEVRDLEGAARAAGLGAAFTRACDADDGSGG